MTNQVELNTKFELVVNTICEDMNKSVAYLEQYKDPQKINNLSNETMYGALLEVGIAIYNLQDRLEIVGIKSDIAKILLEYRKSEIKTNLVTKCSEKSKDDIANINTQIEQENEIIYRRAYKCIKSKVDMAMELINSLKKIVSDRMVFTQMSNGKEYG